MTKIVNRAKMTTATTGTGSISLGSAVGGYQTFADAGVGNGDVVRYVIEDGTAWEIGTGTYSSTGPTLTRSVTESSNADAAISLSGNAVVYVALSAAETIQKGDNVSDLTNDAGYITGNQTISLSGDLSGSGTTSINAQIASNAVGANELNVTGNGTATQYLRSDGDGSFTWATPPDTNTTYSAGSGIGLTGTTFSVSAGGGLTQEASGLAHADTSTQSSVNNSGRTYIQDITLDGYGHVTGITSATETVVDTNTTDLPIENSAGTAQFTATDATGLQFAASGAASVAFDAANYRVTFSSTDTNTTYSAGTALDLSGTTFNVDLSELATSVTDGDGDYFVVVDSVNAQRKLTKSNINISGFNNDAGYTTNVGDITGVTAGAGLTGGGASGSVTLNVGAGTGISVDADTVSLSHLGIESLADPNADRILFWDDSAGAVGWLTAGTNVTISGTTISATDTNTTYSAGSGIGLSGTTFSVAAGSGLTQQASGLAHADTSTQTSVNNSGRTYIQDITLDGFGHVTGITSATETVVNTDTTNLPIENSAGTAQFTATDATGLQFAASGSASVAFDAANYRVTFSATDTNTTYSAGNGIGLSGTTFSVAAGSGLTQQASGLAHADTSTQASLTALTGANVVSDIDLDGFGHVTALATRAMTAADLGALTANQTITLSGDLSGSGSTSINAQIVANAVGAAELNVVGNGTTSQYLRSDGDGTFTWATPPDTNTTYSAGSGISLAGTVFSHSDTSSQGSVNNSGNAVIQDVTLDTYGHVTGLASATIIAPTANGTSGQVLTSNGTATPAWADPAAGEARAWVNFNGTGTVSIRDDGNVSSITDDGTGSYTVNFSTALSSANYAYSHAYSNEVSVYHTVGFLASMSSSDLGVEHYNVTNSTNRADKSYVFLAMFE